MKCDIVQIVTDLFIDNLVVLRTQEKQIGVTVDFISRHWAETRPVEFFAHNVSLFTEHDIPVGTRCIHRHLAFAQGACTARACPE